MSEMLGFVVFISKEYVSFIIGIYKSHVLVSCVGIDFVFMCSL